MWVADPDGARARKVADAGGKNWFTYITWSPDGSHLVDMKSIPGPSEIQNSIEVQDLEHSGARVLFSSPSVQSVILHHDWGILYLTRESSLNGEFCHSCLAELGRAFTRMSLAQELPKNAGNCVSSISATSDGKRLYSLKQAFGLRNLWPTSIPLLSESAILSISHRRTVASFLLLGQLMAARSFLSPDGKVSGDSTVSVLGARVPSRTDRDHHLRLRIDLPRVTPDGAWLVYAPHTPNYVGGAAIDLYGRLSGAERPSEY